uniref:COesterase domain-containing protein n=1 Tax=Strongyloides papillosus TaxID=174720 RepID=A0A0N5C451_STREA
MFKIFLLFHYFLAVIGFTPLEYTTRDGKIIGRRNSKFTSVTEFLGIPFAKPPTGNLRFKPPQQLKKAVPSDPFYADKPANTCLYAYEKSFYYGFKGYDFWHPKSLQQSEDCLQLN